MKKILTGLFVIVPLVFLGCGSGGTDTSSNITPSSVSINSLSDHSVTLSVLEQGSGQYVNLDVTFCQNNRYLINVGSQELELGTWNIVDGEVSAVSDNAQTYTYVVNNNQFKQGETCQVGDQVHDIVDVRSVPDAVCDEVQQTTDTTAPVFTSPGSISVNENQTSAITLKASDNFITVAYSISGADSGSFTVDSTTGQVTFINAPDYETKTSYTFTARATDMAGNYSNQTVSIYINNIDESQPDTTAPVFTSSTSISVNENQTSAITLRATDNVSTVTYSISGTDSGYFSLNASTGVVTFINAPDYETKTSYTFTARATDAAGNYRNQTVVINIMNIVEGLDTALLGTWNWNPTGSSSTFTFNDDLTFSYYSLYDNSGTRLEASGTFNYQVIGTKVLPTNNILVNKMESSTISYTYYRTDQSQTMINYLNSVAYCGYTNWQVNVAKEISSCFPSAGNTIYVIQSNKLYFGMGTFGSDGFQDEIDFNSEYLKQ